MTVKILLAVLLVASLAMCGDGPPEPPAEATPEPSAETPAERCAETVRIYRDLQSPVVIVGQSVKVPEKTVGVEVVEIEYEGTDAMNLPVKGSANCTFLKGTLGLLLVDGTLVDQQGLDSIRGEL
jgi:hypothetical protein